MTNKKATFYVIVVLLVIFLPLTILGSIIKFTNHTNDANPNHELYYQGYLWFYDANNELLSNYECMTEVCEISKTTIDDSEYGMDYYKEGTKENVSILGDYTFITDGNEIKLFNVVTGKVINTYKSIKDYHTDLLNSSVILQNTNNEWGVISLQNITNVIPFEYDFIGLGKEVVDNTLSTTKMVVLKEGNWYIIDNNNLMLSGYLDSPIIDFNDEYIISKSADKIKVYSYSGTEYYNDIEIIDYTRLDNYLALRTSNTVRIYNGLNNEPLKEVLLNTEINKLELQLEDNELKVLVNDNVIDTIAI